MTVAVTRCRAISSLCVATAVVYTVPTRGDGGGYSVPTRGDGGGYAQPRDNIQPVRGDGGGYSSPVAPVNHEEFERWV